MKQILKQAAPHSNYNPRGLNGFEFVEYTAPDATALQSLFLQLGFVPYKKHRSKQVTLYKQGDIHFILNEEKASFAQSFAKIHGPSVCAMSFRVEDAAKAYRELLQLNAKPFSHEIGPMELNIPAIEGVGGSLIYLVDRYDNPSIYDIDFVDLPHQPHQSIDISGVGLKVIDHLTHNVHRGRLDVWAKFYEDLFNFREIRYFDIEGTQTGLFSRAMTSPCNKIRIPINESADDKSQIAEYLQAYNGEGIQHIALSTDNIYETVEALYAKGIQFLDVPDTYYEEVDHRLPGHGEDLERLQKNRILIDGTVSEKTGKAETILLQIFTQNVIGPIFFEIIQRKGNEGFGEGNFTALFESIERDQIRRGVL